MRFCFLLLTMLFNSARAELPAQEAVWDQKAQTWITPQELAARVKGSLVVFGEEHAVEGSLSERVHHENQKRLLQFLDDDVSVGMEFYAYPTQPAVDGYLAGTMNEADFLKAVEWGGNFFDLYKPQTLYPRDHRGVTVALNMPRAISGKVAKQGPDSLSEQERALLPPIWEKGSAPYFERFSEIMGGHLRPDKLENYFWAHSLWDDTMAWRASLRRAAAPAETMIIIVGGFHAEFGHGLPSRLSRHSGAAPVTLLQAEVSEWTDEALNAAVAADPKYGPHADYMWVYKP